MRKVQLVRIGDKYAIKFRYYFSASDYYDFDNTEYRWAKNCKHFKDCLTTKEIAEEVFSMFERDTIIKNVDL